MRRATNAWVREGEIRDGAAKGLQSMPSRQRFLETRGARDGVEVGEGCKVTKGGRGCEGQAVSRCSV